MAHEFSCDLLFNSLLQVDEDRAKPEGQRQFLLAELEDRVRVVVATPNMQQWTLKYGHDKPVSVDCTFGITRYGYAVFTITGMDDTQRGVPLAFAILAGEGEEDFAAVLKAVRDHARKQCPDWSPSVFLSDDSQAEQNAIKYAHRPSLTRHFLVERLAEPERGLVFGRLKFVLCAQSSLKGGLESAETDRF
jgi:hypothetical protein